MDRNELITPGRKPFGVFACRGSGGSALSTPTIISAKTHKKGRLGIVLQVLSLAETSAVIRGPGMVTVRGVIAFEAVDEDGQHPNHRELSARMT